MSTQAESHSHHSLTAHSNYSSSSCLRASAKFVERKGSGVVRVQTLLEILLELFWGVLRPLKNSETIPEFCRGELNAPAPLTEYNGLDLVVRRFLAVNLQGRSLLSQSVTFLDESIDLTRVLINHGARVWPDSGLTNPTSVAEIIQDKEQSAFTWFLRAVINQRGLENSSQTLDCLCHEMGRDPDRMKCHVQRVMLR